MPITDAPFNAELELETWVYANIGSFFGECILLPGFRITTPSGKHGIPDGFAFSFERRAWWIIEAELLSHGVWPHIAEQLTRFVVAGRSERTLRQVRDKLFEAIVEQGRADSVAELLETDRTRLFPKLELFIESVHPSLAVFIDDTNKDLIDFCAALDVSTEVYRVRKFLVDGRAEYYSPDTKAPAVVTMPEENSGPSSSLFDAVEQLGGGELVNSRLRIYKLSDGRLVKVQYSKLHEVHQAYWYGIGPASYETAKELGCTSFIFMMGDDGFVEVPFTVIDEYLTTAYETKNPDGTVRHYHVHISPPPEVVIKGYSNSDDIDLAADFSAWN